jgi:hypothetical protein
MVHLYIFVSDACDFDVVSNIAKISVKKVFP